MHIQYIIEKISLKGQKERSVQDFEKPEIIIGRGSGADILLRESIVAFLHARLCLKENRLFIERIESRKCIISVNGRVIKQSLLMTGDTIIIGNTTLTVAFENEVWQLIEVRKELTQEEEDLWLSKSLRRVDITKRLPSMAMISILLVAPLVLYFLVGPLMGAYENSWSSGPISSSHKFMETDCKSCHTQVFKTVQDKACTQCHRMGEHSIPLAEKTAQNLPFENQCRTCHQEHNGNGKLILSNPVLCVSCHGDIQTIHPKATIPSIKGFDSTHPEFALLKNSVTDKGKIKLNHFYHLTSIEMDDPKGGKRPMVCQDCHVPDPSSAGGGYMKEITYDEFCASCHNLNVGSTAPNLNVPHEKSQLVRTFLRSPTDFLYEYVQDNTALLASTPKPSSRRSRRKKASPIQKTQKQWVQKQFKSIIQRGGLTKLENEIFFSAKGGCIECHFLDVQPVAGVSQDSSLAAFSLWDHDIRVWDIAINQDKRALKGHEDVVHSVQFDLAGKRLLSASRDFTARIWNLENPEEEVKVFRIHTGSVNDAAFFPSEDKIITGSDDGKAVIWDIANQKALLTLSSHERPIVKVQINSSGTRALTQADDGTAILWDTADGKNLGNLKSAGAEVLVAQFSPDGKQVAGGLSDGSIKFWSAGDGKENAVFPSEAGSGEQLPGHSKSVTHLEFSGDGSKMISLSEDFSAKIWDLGKGVVVATLVVYEKEKKNIIRQLFLSASFNGDGSQVATGSTDKKVRLWDTGTGKLLDEFKGHENQVPITFFTRDGSKIITAAYNNTAIIWDVETKQKETLKHGEPVTVKGEENVDGEGEKEGEEEDGEKSLANDLRLPETLPSQIPKRFFSKGKFNHLKHEYLDCKICHQSVAKSVSTLDVSMPPIQICRTCHEKDKIHLNDCIYCHNYHPENERGFSSGHMVLDEKTPLGYHFLKQ